MNYVAGQNCLCAVYLKKWCESGSAIQRGPQPLEYVCKNKKNITSGAPVFWCAISVFHTNGASPTGAPLVYSSGALLPWCAISINPIYSPFPSSGYC